LSKKAGRRTRPSSGSDEGSGTDDPPGEGGPDEAAAFIAETVADLARIARRHQLDMLASPLEMAQMEADERVRLRGKHNLS
jgi:hypothetical protein